MEVAWGGGGRRWNIGGGAGCFFVIWSNPISGFDLIQYQVGASFGFVKEDVLLPVNDQDQSLMMEVVMSPPMIQVGSPHLSENIVLLLLLKFSQFSYSYLNFSCGVIWDASSAMLTRYHYWFQISAVILKNQKFLFRTPSVLRGRLAVEAPKRLLFQNPIKRNEVFSMILSF